MSEQLPPQQVGDVVELTIDNLAFGGDGVGRVAGRPVFVPDTIPGERVRVHLDEVRPRFARGTPIEVLRRAGERVEPFCELFGQCGGCRLQHLDYAAQLEAKTGMVRELLTRVGRLPDVPVRPIIASPLPLGYRNKVEFTADRGDDGTGLSLCYHERNPELLVPPDACGLLLPEVEALAGLVASWLNATGWPAYDPRTSEGLVRSVALRYSTATREANLLLTTGRRDLPEKMPWIADLRQTDPRLVGVRHIARTRASQSLAGRPVGDLIGRALRFKVKGLSLRVSPEAFFQVNEAFIEPLVELVIAALEPESGDHIADLYGGVGTFGLPLAGLCRHVTTLEIDPAAANDARANVRFNGLENVTVLKGQVEQQLREVDRERPLHKVIVDPPRRGLSEPVIGLLARLRPRRIVYVSCDPATLARDLHRFAEERLRPVFVQPLDMFPQTAHIEALAVIEAG